MERLHRVIGPSRPTSTCSRDPRSREAIAIDTATPCLAWIADELAARDWTLKLIVSTHGHWDHIGDNAAVAEHTGAEIAVHPLDRDRLINPQPCTRRSRSRRRCRRSTSRRAARSASARSGCGCCTRPGHTEGSVCLLDATRACCSAATRCSPAAGVGSTCPAATPTRWSRRSADCWSSRTASGVFPGHGAETTIGRERPWLELVRDQGRLLA